MRQLGGRGLKFVIALLCAVALWTYVSFSTNPSVERLQTVPITPSNLPADLVIVDPKTGAPLPLTQEASFQISGPQDQVDAARAADFKARLDLSAMTAGGHAVPVQVNGPAGIRVRNIQPLTMTIQLDTIARRELPVKVTPQGQLPFLFTLGSIRPSRTTVEVQGPSELVAAAANATVIMPLQNQTSSISGTFPLQAVDQNGSVLRGLTITPRQLDVQVAINPRVQNQQVSVVPNLQGALPPGYTLSALDWEPKFVQVLASSTITGTLTTEPVDLDELKQSTSKVVRLADQANIITQPSAVVITVSLTIRPIALQSQLPLLVPIAPVGIGDGLVATASPAAIQITLAGSLDELSKVTLNDVSATVDLKDRGVGTYQLPVGIQKPDGLQLVTALDQQVTITIAPASTPAASTTGPR